MNRAKRKTRVLSQVDSFCRARDRLRGRFEPGVTLPLARFLSPAPSHSLHPRDLCWERERRRLLRCFVPSLSLSSFALSGRVLSGGMCCDDTILIRERRYLVTRYQWCMVLKGESTPVQSTEYRPCKMDRFGWIWFLVSTWLWSRERLIYPMKRTFIRNDAFCTCFWTRRVAILNWKYVTRLTSEKWRVQDGNHSPLIGAEPDLSATLSCFPWLASVTRSGNPFWSKQIR